MHHASLAALAALAISPTAVAQTAQNPAAATPDLIRGPVRFAGTFHAASRTFTHGQAATANFGTSDAIYAANADTPYFSALESFEIFGDSGIIPGSTNPLAAGARDETLVTSFDFAYCDFDATIGTSQFEISFYESYAPCTSQVGFTPTATVVVDQIPADGCWVVNVDLTGGAEFCIRSDGGDGIFNGNADLDSFGWTVDYQGGGTSGAGPILAADPSATDAVYSNPNGPPVIAGPGGTPNNPPAPSSSEGTGTYYNPLSGCTSAFTAGGVAKETGSGLRNEDFWFIEDTVTPANSGCFYFLGYFNLAATCGAGLGAPLTGNNPFSAFYMEINGTEDCSSVGDCICNTTACPSTNNSSGVPGVCTALGSSIVADNNIILQASNLPTSPAGVFGIFLHGLNDISATPIAVGQGVLCIGNAGRFQANNQIQQANANGIAELSSAAGDFSLSNLPIATSPFSVTATAGVTSYFGFWHRDFVTPSNAAFNFTGVAEVVWQ